MSDDWNLKKCKEVHLKEYDADIYHWDKKIDETIEIELCQRLMIPESNIRTKGTPRYFLALRTSDIEILRQKLINDIDVIDCTEESKLSKWEIIEEVLNIIDKRFGLDNI